MLTAWATQYGHPLVTALDPIPALSPDARYELLASMREALENIRRHTAGAPVRVSLRSDEETGELVIADEGPGFDVRLVAQREAEGHFGLRGMRERLQMIGGTSRWESVIGSGTTVTLRVPLTDLNLLPRI